MLSVLRIRNLAIIDELEVEFQPGLNVLTGETGAGKSVLLKAIDLLSGRRAAAGLVRKSENDKFVCEVEGLFTLTTRDREILAESGAEVEDLEDVDELLVRRVVESTGRSKIYLNGRLSTGAVVQRISACLFDMTSQHQQQMLNDTSKHRDFIDQFGVPAKILEQVRVAYADYSRARHSLKSHERESDSKQRHYRELAFERDELSSAQLRKGERKGLEAELKKLSSVELITEIVDRSLLLLENEGEGVCDKLARLEVELTSGVELDSALSSCMEFLVPAIANADEARFFLQDYSSRLEVDPQRLEFLRERIAEIAMLERKYLRSEDELVEYFESIEAELACVEAGEFDVEKIREEVGRTLEILKGFEKQLTEKRTKAALRLSKLVEDELSKLNMPRARFTVKIAPRESSSAGSDEIEFMLAANPGEPSCSITKVASGGELSRILLVLKTLLNEQQSASLQIFDEIDIGVGGAVAHVVGEKLKQVSKGSQVLLITHSPQVAAMADYHYVISKRTSDERTYSSVKLLCETERVEEIARMLAGKKITKEFTKSAMKLLGYKDKTVPPADSLPS